MKESDNPEFREHVQFKHIDCFRHAHKHTLTHSHTHTNTHTHTHTHSQTLKHKLKKSFDWHTMVTPQCSHIESSWTSTTVQVPNISPVQFLVGNDDVMMVSWWRHNDLPLAPQRPWQRDRTCTCVAWWCHNEIMMTSPWRHDHSPWVLQSLRPMCLWASCAAKWGAWRPLVSAFRRPQPASQAAWSGHPYPASALPSLSRSPPGLAAVSVIVETREVNDIQTPSPC